MGDANGLHGDDTGDELPEDLDVTAYVGPYVFPDIRRRRIAGAIYAVTGLAALAGGIAADNNGLLFGGVLLLLIALYHWFAGWPLKVDQTDALAVASRTVGFPVGHTSAQLAWRGSASAGPPGASSCTAPTNHPASAGWSSSMPSTATCSASTPSATPRTGRRSDKRFSCAGGR